MSLVTCFVPSLPALEPGYLAPALEPARPLAFPLDQIARPSTHLFYLARAGVYHALSHLLGEEDGTVLMPAYHHGVEVEAVRATGARILFYRIDAQMQIDLEDLERRLRSSGARVVYVTHYVGFAQPVAEVARLCRAHGARLFEDCALALFSRGPDGLPLGTTGDAAVFCLYKTLPVPHGGLLLAPGMPAPELGSPPLFSTLHHVAGLALMHLELRSQGLGRAVRAAARSAAHATCDQVLDTVKTNTMHLRPEELHLGASWLTGRLLERFDAEMVRVRRRRNFSRLAAALDGIVPVLGAPLAGGVCPLFVPVRVADKPGLLSRLRQRGIDAIDFWGVGDPACDASAFPEVAELRRQVLELPCHQSLDDHAIDAVAQAVNQAIAHA